MFFFYEEGSFFLFFAEVQILAFLSILLVRLLTEKKRPHYNISVRMYERNKYRI